MKERIFTSFSLFILFAFQSCSNDNAHREVIPVIVMAGQSNMEGPNDASAVPSPYNLLLPNAKVFYKKSTDGPEGEIASLQYGVNNNWRESELKTCGPELSIGYQLPLEIGGKIGIIKYSLGGSRLVDDSVTECKAGLWDVNGDPSRAGAYGLHFKKLVNNFVKPAIQKYIDAGYTPKIAAFVWCQGESDATIQYCAKNYEVKLTQLLNEFKNQLRTLDPGVDTMQVVISRIHNNFTPGKRPYLIEVRTALENVGNKYTNAHWINTDAYPLMPDSTHWTKAGQIMHGLDITNTLKEVIVRKAAPARRPG